MPKKMIARVTDAYVNFDGDTLVSIAERIKELTEDYGPDAYLDYRMEDYSDDYVYKLMTKSEETDDEYAHRMAKDERNRISRKHQFEALKKEFEGDN
jgi:hypothetical protein